MGVERAHQPLHTVTVARHRELQLFQILRVHKPADEQRVARHVSHEAAEVLPLRRPSGAEQLRERVLVGQLVPMAVVFHPERAHEAPQVGGENDDGEDGGAGSRELGAAAKDRTHQGERHRNFHRFDLPYVPMSCAVASTWPSMAASTSLFCAPALSFSGASIAYSLKK